MVSAEQLPFCVCNLYLPAGTFNKSADVPTIVPFILTHLTLTAFLGTTPVIDPNPSQVPLILILLMSIANEVNSEVLPSNVADAITVPVIVPLYCQLPVLSAVTVAK